MPLDDPLRRFVVLEHRWNGVHWDFLIEDGQTLRTWAIDEPIVADRVLPARSLAPHRRFYLDHEGAVSGNRGTVHQWEVGSARVEIWSDWAIRLKVEGAQLVGVVDFWEEGGDTEAEGPRRWLFRFGKLS